MKFCCNSSERLVQQESLSTPVVGIIPAKKKSSAWKLSRRSKRHFEEQMASVEIQIRKLVHMDVSEGPTFLTLVRGRANLNWTK